MAEIAAVVQIRLISPVLLFASALYYFTGAPVAAANYSLSVREVLHRYLEVTGGQVVFLFQKTDTKSNYDWAFEVNASVVVWKEIRFAEVDLLKKYSVADMPCTVVVLSPSRPFLHNFMHLIESQVQLMPLMKLFLIIRDIDYTLFPRASCKVVSPAFDGRSLNMAAYPFVDCTKRTMLDLRGLEGNISRGWSALKHTGLIGGAGYTKVGRRHVYRYKLSPMSQVIVKALQRNNVSLTTKRYPMAKRNLQKLLLDREIDVTLDLHLVVAQKDTLIKCAAVSTMRCLTFFSIKRPGKHSVIKHLFQFLKYFTIYLLTCGVIFLGVYIVQAKLLGDDADLGQAVFFMLSVLLSNSSQHQPISSTRTACVLWSCWMLASLVLRSYMTSVITSQSQIPSFRREIETTARLESLAAERKVLPCVAKDDASDRFVELHKAGLPYRLQKLLDACPGGCVEPSGAHECRRLARQGTHVYIRFLDRVQLSRTPMPELAPATDCMAQIYASPLVAKDFPYAKPLRKLLMNAAESGLEQAEEAVLIHRHADMLTARRLAVELAPRVLTAYACFDDYVLVYACGVMLALAVFCAETCPSLLARHRRSRRMMAKMAAGLHRTRHARGVRARLPGRLGLKLSKGDVTKHNPETSVVPVVPPLRH